MGYFYDPPPEHPLRSDYETQEEFDQAWAKCFDEFDQRAVEMDSRSTIVWTMTYIAIVVSVPILFAIAMLALSI